MPLTRYAVLSMLLLLALAPRAGWCILGVGDTAVVHDPINFVKSAETAFNTAKQIKIQADQLIAQYNMVRNTITMIDNQVKNLQRIPSNLNMFDAISAYSNSATGLLNSATALSFQLNQGTKQFEALYKTVGTVTQPKDILAMRKKMLDARMQTIGVGVQVQSIQSNMTDVYTRLCSLLNGSFLAKGNLDSQQIKAQQDALLLHSQQQAQAMLATAQRLEAMRAAEDAVLQQLQIQEAEALSTPRGTYVSPGVTMMTLGW